MIGLDTSVLVAPAIHEHPGHASAERLWGARECRRLSGGPAAVAILLDWMTLYGLGRERLLDTM